MHVSKVIISVANPLLYYVPFIYGIIKSFDFLIGVDSSLQIIWDKIREKLGDNLAYYNIGLFFVCIFISYYGLLLIFYVMVEFMERDKIKYMKMQDRVIDLEKPSTSKAIINVLLNFVGTAVIVIVQFFLNIDFLRFRIDPELPKFSVVMLQLFLHMIIHEFAFYYSHRLFHTKWLYKYHKKHHEYKSPTILASLYAGFADHLFLAYLPGLFGIYLLRMHVLTAILTIATSMVTVMIGHFGYHIPFFNAALYHDYHHYKPTRNFSIFGVADYIHGTFKYPEVAANYEKTNVWVPYSNYSNGIKKD